MNNNDVELVGIDRFQISAKLWLAYPRCFASSAVVGA
jgi:hypothetical protein